MESLVLAVLEHYDKALLLIMVIFLYKIDKRLFRIELLNQNCPHLNPAIRHEESHCG